MNKIKIENSHLQAPENLDYTVNPRYNDSIPKDVPIKMSLLLYRILNEQIDM